MTNVTFKFVRSAEPQDTDDEYEIYLNEVKVPFSIQCADNHRLFCVNEYAPEETPLDDWWMKEHEAFMKLESAKLRATQLVLATLTVTK